MFKIGEFSKISGLSVDTLHHYEKMNILLPVFTDTFTGYRYYDAAQLVTVNKIVALKDANFSLQEISNLIGSDITVKDFLKLVEDKANFLEEVLKQETEKLNRLRNNIFLIKNGGIPQMNEIIVKRVEPILNAALRKKFHKSRFDEELEYMWEEVNRVIVKNNVKRTVPCMMLYHTGWWNLDESENLEVEVVEPVTKEFSGEGEVKVYELPSEDYMACIVHHGSFATIGKVFEELFDWIKQNNYAINGPLREIYHKGDWATNNTEEYVTEIQVPIKAL